MSAPAPILGFEQRAIGANGVTLSYRVGGDPAGPPVLLWHGFLGTSYTWRKVAPLLAARGFSALVPDMRGYGTATNPRGRRAMTG